jgi:hypothetical protein
MQYDAEINCNNNNNSNNNSSNSKNEAWKKKIE